MIKRLQTYFSKVTLLFLTLLVATVALFQNIRVNAQDSSLWVNDGTVTYEIEGEAIEDHAYGLTCHKDDITQTVLRSGVPTDQTVSDQCMIPLEFGTMSSSGQYFIPKMATKAGNVWNNRLIPVPNTHKLYQQAHRNDIYGTRHIDVYDGAILRHGYHNTNGIQYAYSFSSNGAENKRAKWDDGRDIVTMSGQLAVSTNGKWMIVRASGGHILRINLETMEVMNADRFGTGWPNPRGDFDFAISDDGAYGVVSGRTFAAEQPSTRIIDFSACDTAAPQNGAITPGCGVRNVTDFIAEMTGEAQVAGFPTFNIDNTQIQFNAHVGGEYKRIAMIAPGETYSGLDYLAMGDSFASGEGDLDDGHYEEGTNISVSEELPEGEKCHISRRSYPYLVARNIGVPDERFRSVACSGAEIADVNNRSNRYIGQQERLRNFSDEDIRRLKQEAVENFTPGRTAQIEFVEKYKPKIVTISIGGNDVGFAEIMKECLNLMTQCDLADSDNADKRYAKAYELQQKFKELSSLYTEIHKTSPQTKIYVLGYSKIMEREGSCHLLSGFNERERKFVDESFMYMNRVVEAAAKHAGVEYLNVENALGGATICGNEKPRAANALRMGDDISHEKFPNIRVVGAESYHPNQHGHARIAGLIAPRVKHQPCAGSAFVCPSLIVIPPAIPEYFTTPVNNAPEWRQPYSSLRLSEEDMYLIGGSVDIRQGYLYSYSSQTVIELHSEPRHLGTFTVDEEGSLNASVTIPEDIPAGYHTLRVKGTLISGEEAEFYQTILVLGREGDRDNNGVPDIEQECLEAPVAITDNTGKVVVPPCAGIDDAFNEVVPPDDGGGDGPGESAPPLEEIIRQARQIVTSVLRNNIAYERLSFEEHQRIDDLLERRAVPKIAQVITQCYSHASGFVLVDIGIFKIQLHCHQRGNDIQLNISVYIGPFRLLVTSPIIRMDSE